MSLAVFAAEVADMTVAQWVIGLVPTALTGLLIFFANRALHHFEATLNQTANEVRSIVTTLAAQDKAIALLNQEVGALREASRTHAHEISAMRERTHLLANRIQRRESMEYLRATGTPLPEEPQE